MPQQNKAYFYAILAMFCWSTVATAFKIALSYTDYLTLLLISSFVSAITLLVILIAQGKIGQLFSLSKKDILKSASLGVLNPFLYYLILFKAYSLLKAQEALALNYTWAIVVVILSVFLLKQKIKFLNFIGILVGFIGVITIASKGNFADMQFSNPYGVALALSSSLVWAIFWILNIKDNKDAIIKLFLNFLSGFILTLILMITTSHFTFPGLNGFLASAYVGLFEMGITFVFWLLALKYSRTTAQVSSLIYFSPFLSLIFISIILKEQIHYSTIIGLVFIIFGILIQSIKSKKSQLTN